MGGKDKCQYSNLAYFVVVFVNQYVVFCYRFAYYDIYEMNA